MIEINNKKVHRGHSLLKVLGTALLTLVVLVSTVGAEPSSNITFVTTGSSFSPIITVTGNPTIQWVFGDNSTSNSASPTVDFGSAGTRVNTLVVTPWSAVTKINIGYDGSDEGVNPSSSTIANLEQQNVIAVSGLENVAPYLQVWASNYNPITELNFNNFTVLDTVECFSCRSLATINLHNVPSLIRLCVEQSNISYLDTSEAPSLADLRGASQKNSIYTINWGTTGANIWHICVRDNPQMKSTFPSSQFPLLREFFNWNDNQSGTLHLTSTNLRRVLSTDNYYNAAVLSGCFPAGITGELQIQNNNLSSLDISNDPGLLILNASFNSLNQTAVDDLLQILDSYNTNSGFLDLTGNAAPSTVGAEHANNLTARDWEVKVSSKNNLPIANFTSNVTFGMVPLAVQFNDTSTNNPTKWLWNFGDGTYSAEKSPKHSYMSQGNYTVAFTVRNSNGFDSEVGTIIVLEQPAFLIAEFSASNTSGYAPLSITFTDLSQNATEWNWDFGDGITSNVPSPIHTYSVAGTYNVRLTVYNGNNVSSKNTTITVLASNSEDDSDSGGSSHSSGGGGAGGSPEPAKNVEVKELSQVFITNGKAVQFNFTKNATCVVYANFDAKKTVGKTTTIVEQLKNKSTLVSNLIDGEVYRYFNVWVGNSGFAGSENIENPGICFKVEKSWLQDENMDQDSITLNRFSNKTWDRIPTSLSGQDNKYLYFTSSVSGYSFFAITGKTTANEENKINRTENVATPKPGTQENKRNNATSEIDQTSGEENKGMPDFKIIYCVIGLFVVFLCRRR